MPSVRCLERQLLCKPECHEDLFAPSLALLKVSLGEHQMNGFCQPMFILEGVQLTGPERKPGVKDR